MMDRLEIETIVVGSGASGLNAADLLWRRGCRNLAVVTEAWNAGTSRNTGSDKQTYYKLSLAGDDFDGVIPMARDFFEGKCVDGDIALCEAAMSVPSFTRLAALGVPFPHDRFGQFVGYRTDHDSKKRATSAGPYTSRFMTEALERQVIGDGIQILNGYQMIRIITCSDTVQGAIFLERKTNKLLLIRCRSLVLATGGPAGIYKMSVYPESQFGATGLALEAGCSGKNLTEWQYGLASVKPRWNVSGSYMQVMPRFLSVDQNGVEHDFLSSYPIPRGQMLSLIFLKGYQWPFDVRKLENGSSIIDILCYLELEKGRRVFLDFMHNPDNQSIPFEPTVGSEEVISEEAHEYLKASGALLDTPIKRLRKLNEPAYQFYLDRNVDLEREMLEISLSAQHNNGGLSIDCWWQSDVEGIFPVGEVAGSHGVYRPGGSALNAGQVGSARAAEYIATKRTGNWCLNDTLDCACAVDEAVEWAEKLVKSCVECDMGNCGSDGGEEVAIAYDRLRNRMSLYASCIRNHDLMVNAFEETKRDLENFSSVQAISDGQVWLLFEYRNALIESLTYLAAMIDYCEKGSGSRGSALYSDLNGTIQPKFLDNRFKFSLECDPCPPIQEIKIKDNTFILSRRLPRPIPTSDDFFENVWARFRKDGCVY